MGDAREVGLSCTAETRTSELEGVSPAPGVTPGRTDAARGEPRAGTLFACRYEIQELLGEGGMGIVYKAYDRRLEETVAIKTLRHRALCTDPSLLERFRQEIRLARRITHPNVVRTHDIGEWNGLRFVSMELVDGRTLGQLIESEKILGAEAALRIAKQICRGLQAIHQVGIVHGDVKPQNVMVQRSGGSKIMDFGSAHLASEGGTTARGTIVGTLGYMSPEQARGRPLDFRADIYSLGILLYELFTGTLPFEDDTPVGVALKHIQQAPPPPRSKHSAIDPEVAAVVMKCLEKDADARFQSARDLLRALERISPDPRSGSHRLAVA
jgi:serine/threonine-protein kinase